jgi:hypothetical protein
VGDAAVVVTIHQPEHLPWLGFFDKVRQADVCVMLDHVPFRKNYYQNRNRIRAEAGARWLTVPVLLKGRTGQPINEVRINNQGSPRWKHKCWASLEQHYRKAAYWSLHEAFFEDLYHADWAGLTELNETIIRYMLGALSIPTLVKKSSELRVEGHKGDLLLEICRQVGADVYLSGVSGKSYLDVARFGDAGIEVRFQDFHHPIYRQRYEPFSPCLSSVDLLFNYGPASLDVLKGVGVETMDHVFE